ncbi:hypothetical protein FSP39_018632 [Pinctada imbricata]|uniref:Uncharacterized protein n=1 Tax=Pinctada imbricata TaxID=66713 RepID=A0AA89BUH3_PINIB|nr:hypothetical protein FSP39_018632 [Pinctada imbricata]
MALIVEDISVNSENSQGDEKYIKDIAFSNACRQYYYTRLEATENFCQDVKNDESKSQTRKVTTSIDSAMEKLRKEMASLMKQDLTLMRQLLTLNDTIEDMKSQRLYGSSRESILSSRDLHSGSDWSVSETDMYTPDDHPVDKESVNSKIFCVYEMTPYTVPVVTVTDEFGTENTLSH